ncbi:MAG: GIY-YIG nuclease family protein [Patescibacteria group bacterium]
MLANQLRQLIAKTPDAPGIYCFQNEHKKDIYIGKASSIKKRLVSYTKTTDPRIQKMIAVAERLTHIKTNSDIEALILESQLIKQHRPQFNIMLRDDKQYFFVGFTDTEFPRLFLTHQPELAGDLLFGPVAEGDPRSGGTDGTGSPGLGKRARSPANYIGPFTDGTALKTTLKFLRNIFPYCTCTQKHHNFCLNYHLNKCIGFCCIKNPELRITDYGLKKVKKQYNQNTNAIKDILSGHHSSVIKELKKEMTATGKKHDFDNAIELRSKLERLKRVFHNAQIIKHSEILKSYNSGLSALLKTKKPIIHIEGYDVSNIQGAHATGAMVTFVNGLPDKNFYRKFNTQYNKPKNNKDDKNKLLLNSYDRKNLANSANDTAMLAQILERRFRHPEWPFPDLILVDGGKGQVSSALTVLKEMNISIPVIGLSKNKKHMGHQLIIPGRKQPLSLTKLSITDKNLLLTIGAEAHRFAISYYRKLHRLNLSTQNDIIKNTGNA